MLILKLGYTEGSHNLGVFIFLFFKHWHEKIQDIYLQEISFLACFTANITSTRNGCLVMVVGKPRKVIFGKHLYQCVIPQL